MSFHSLSFPVVNWKMKTVVSWGGEFSTTWFHRLCFGYVGGADFSQPRLVFPLLQQRIFCNCLSIFAESLFPFNIQHVWQKSRTVPKIIKPVPGIKWHAALWFVSVLGGGCRQYGFGLVKFLKIVFSVTSCGINKNIFSTVARAEMWLLSCEGAVEGSSHTVCGRLSQCGVERWITQTLGPRRNESFPMCDGSQELFWIQWNPFVSLSGMNIKNNIQLSFSLTWWHS